MPETDILIIGGGAIGVCCAHYLSRQGRRVTLLEQAGIASGSSYGNAGLIVPNHCVPLAEPGVVARGLRWLCDPESPFYIKPRLSADLISWLWRFWRHCTPGHVRRAMPLLRDMNLASVRLFEELAEDLDFGFEQKGGLTVFRTPEGLKAGVEEARLLRKIGIRADILDPAETQRLVPQTELRTIGGVYYPQNAHLDPARFVRALAQHAARNGATILPETEVLEIETSGARIAAVRTTRGIFTAPDIILAGGAWSPSIVRGLGLNLPIQPAKGYSITVERPKNSPDIPLMLAEARAAVTPMGAVLRFAGTLELAGYDRTINQRRVRAILRAVPAYLPQIDPERLPLLETWRGWRPCTPDGLPFLGRSQTFNNLIVAAGHATIGISLSAITGKTVAQIIAGAPPSIDLGLLRVERFA